MIKNAIMINQKKECDDSAEAVEINVNSNDCFYVKLYSCAGRRYYLRRYRPSWRGK
jgi:hypothetical protein